MSNNEIVKKPPKAQNNGEEQERLISKDFLLLMAVSAGQSLMTSFFLAALPLYITRIGGLTVHVGILTTAFVLAALAMRPISGKLSDKYGRMRLLIAGMLLSSATCALFGIVGAMPMLIIVRVLNGAGFGTSSTCSGAAAADVLPKERLAEGIGYFGLSATLAHAVGPGIALAIVANDALTDYQALFYTTAAICAASAVCGFCVSYERKKKKTRSAITEKITSESEKTPEATDAEPLPKTIMGFEYAVFAPVTVLILTYVGVGGLMSFLTPFAKWRGIGNPGLYFMVNAAGTIISRLIFGRVADKRGSDIVIIPGMAVLIACIALLSTVRTSTALVLIALPLGLSQGAVMPTFNSMLFKRCSPARRGTASGAFSASVDAGFAIGAPLLGAIADARDYRYIFWVGAVFVALALALYILIASDKRHAARQERRTVYAQKK